MRVKIVHPFHCSNHMSYTKEPTLEELSKPNPYIFVGTPSEAHKAGWRLIAHNTWICPECTQGGKVIHRTELIEIKRRGNGPDVFRLLNEVERLNNERAWKPIETAPKDGTRVLVWEKDAVCSKIAFYGRMAKYGREFTWVIEYDEDGFAVAANPSHWMPLPEKPEAEL